MAGVFHILVKDVRRLRWLLVLWIALLGVRVVFAAAAMRYAGDTFGPGFALEGLGGIVGTLETLLLALLVARLVHEEPLVGLNAFWLTRPYSPGSLLSAKLLIASVAFVLLPVVADLLTMSLFDAGASAQRRASSVFLSSHLMWMLPLFVLAALTPTLGGFAIAIIGVVAALSLVIAVLIGMAAFSVDESETYLPVMTFDPTPAIVGSVVFAAAALSVIVYQYRRRRLRIAIAIAAVGLLATALVPAFWPWPFARSAPIEPGTWAADPSTTTAVVDRSVPMQISDARAFNREGIRKRYVHAHVQLAGMPADTFARNIGVRGMLMLADGTIVRSRQANAFVPLLESRGPVGFGPSVPLGVLGDVEVLTRFDETAYQPWAALLTLTEDQYVTYRGQSGLFQGEVDFPLMQTRIRGALPLVAGAALEDAGSRVELVRVERRIDAQAITVRQWQARSLLDQDRSREFEFVLRNRARGEVLTATRRGGRPGFGGGSVFTGSTSVIPFALLAGGSAGPPSDGFSMQVDVLEFPMTVMPSGVTIQLDPGWLDEAEVVVLESDYAGTITRPLTIENFVIPN